ncbi:3-hydroxybenzoate 6-monooxygenase superfamily protein [Emydomyces testavorans]|uniref:3-hydroxybenzoate 6-monooxygenase superfamily protein n=1 Tax=Emydomyces testavorans TaxID=2070801 RepID=A0AAF0DCQ4_9EURO|nr:3-hydroxybenzoate 6-monooxygenase superfamily protein [Emydomyces testavorans]
MVRPQFHVVIVGAGLGGLAAAIGIAKARHKVTLLEQAPELGEIGAGIQIPPNASLILKRWGVLDEIETVSVRPKDFVLRSYRDGKVLSVQNVFPFLEDRYGAPYLHIHRADYHKILLKEVRRLGVTILLDSTVVGVDFEKPAVHLKGKPDFHADVVFGADGLKSTCREALLGHPDPPRMTGDLAYRIIVKAEDMRKNPELSDFLDNPCMNYWMGPSAHVVCYFLQGGGLYNIVLVCPDNLPELVSIAQADVEEMRTFFEHWDPRLKVILGLVQETKKWRLQNSEEMERWSHPGGKFALLGDACHATLPYLAQGAAQALEDGAFIGTLFENIEDESQLSDVLAIYEKVRKPRTTRVVRGSTALRDIFHMHDGPAQEERDRILLNEKPFIGYPNRWADPVFQKFLFDYDARGEALRAWSEYKKGKSPKSINGVESRL